MTTSILDETKQQLGIASTDTVFDVDIIAPINTAFMTLHQFGIGPTTVFSISDNTPVWTDFVTDLALYQAVKTYVYISTRLVFDPPGTSFHLDSMKRMKEELEFRLSIQVPIPPTI